MSDKTNEKPRWRAKKCGRYFYITSLLEVRPERDYNTTTDIMYYRTGNYFRKAKAAEKVAGQIKEILINSKAE